MSGIIGHATRTWKPSIGAASFIFAYESPRTSECEGHRERSAQIAIYEIN